MKKKYITLILLLLLVPLYCLGCIIVCVSKIIRAIGFMFLIAPASARAEMRGFFKIRVELADAL